MQRRINPSLMVRRAMDRAEVNCVLVRDQRYADLSAASGRRASTACFERIKRFVGPAAMREIPAHDLPRAAVDSCTPGNPNPLLAPPILAYKVESELRNP